MSDSRESLAQHRRWSDLPAERLKGGMSRQLVANLPHRASATEDTLGVDVFNPPRADWLAGTDAYLRT